MTKEKKCPMIDCPARDITGYCMYPNDVKKTYDEECQEAAKEHYAEWIDYEDEFDDTEQEHFERNIHTGF